MLTSRDSLTVVYGMRHSLFFRGAALTSLRKSYYSSSHNSTASSSQYSRSMFHQI
jgi:hypothetical protein